MKKVFVLMTLVIGVISSSEAQVKKSSKQGKDTVTKFAPPTIVKDEPVVKKQAKPANTKKQTKPRSGTKKAAKTNAPKVDLTNFKPPVIKETKQPTQ